MGPEYEGLASLVGRRPSAIPPTPKYILLLIAVHVGLNKPPTELPGFYLTTESGLPSQTVGRAIEWLERSGVLTVDRTGRAYLYSVRPGGLRSKLTHSSEVRRELSGATRRRVLERDGNTCKRCGAKDDLEVDHIVPVRAYGTNEEDNLQALCGPCNHAKVGEDNALYGIEALEDATAIVPNTPPTTLPAQSFVAPVRRRPPPTVLARTEAEAVIWQHFDGLCGVIAEDASVQWQSVRLKCCRSCIEQNISLEELSGAAHNLGMQPGRGAGEQALINTVLEGRGQGGRKHSRVDTIQEGLALLEAVRTHASN